LTNPLKGLVLALSRYTFSNNVTESAYLIEWNEILRENLEKTKTL
jgi:hypothetical protein